MTYEVGILCHLHMSFYYRGHLLNIPIYFYNIVVLSIIL